MCGQAGGAVLCAQGYKTISSPVMNFIAAGVCKIFSGTSVGEAILSAPLPSKEGPLVLHRRDRVDLLVAGDVRGEAGGEVAVTE